MADFKSQLKAKKDKEAQERLEKRLAKEAAGEKASMIPRGRKPRQEEEKEPLQDIRELDFPPAVRLKLIRISKQMAAINQAMSPLLKAKKDLATQAKLLMEPYGKLSFMVDGIPCSHYPTNRATIQAHLLAEANVPISVIKAATKASTSWAFKVTPEGTDPELELD